jgi:hypothetical protein
MRHGRASIPGTGNASLETIRAGIAGDSFSPPPPRSVMVDVNASAQNSGDAERDRIARDIAGRLYQRGVDVRDDDSDTDITDIEEEVERFESLVQAQGGDLMVDEPPRGQKGRPDDARFRLPLRHADESAKAYVERLRQASANLRSRRHEEG